MSPTIIRRLSLANVIVNVAIVITGGTVRLTGSGLGCPSWPNCQPGAFHVTPEMGIHGYIEWGNRLFGVIVAIVAVATLFAVLRAKPRRKDLVTYATLVAVGVPAQALIGLITVSTNLNPWVVSTHFLVTVAMVAAAYLGYARSCEPAVLPPPTTPPTFGHLLKLLVIASLAAIILGALVTGSGPHAGDPDAPRIPLDPTMLSQVHAHSVLLLIGLTVAAVFAAKALSAPRATVNAVWLLLAVELAQGAIGFIQFFTGLPVILVGAHMLGAALLWLAVIRVAVVNRRAAAEADSDRNLPRQPAAATA